MRFWWISFHRCLSQQECEGVTLEDCDYPMPMMSLNATSSFDCEQHCKVDVDCFFFQFHEDNGTCELFESEYRSSCLDVSATMVRNFNVQIKWTIQILVAYFLIQMFSSIFLSKFFLLQIKGYRYWTMYVDPKNVLRESDVGRL